MYKGQIRPLPQLVSEKKKNSSQAYIYCVVLLCTPTIKINEEINNSN